MSGRVCVKSQRYLTSICLLLGGSFTAYNLHPFLAFEATCSSARCLQFEEREVGGKRDGGGSTFRNTPKGVADQARHTRMESSRYTARNVSIATSGRSRRSIHMLQHQTHIMVFGQWRRSRHHVCYISLFHNFPDFGPYSMDSEDVRRNPCWRTSSRILKQSPNHSPCPSHDMPRR